MKTAMQELFSKLETEHPNLFNTNTQEGRKFINDYYQFFELEKEQIIDSFDAGCEDDNLIGKEYYNKIFKNDQ
jgi:hypothetical protein